MPSCYKEISKYIEEPYVPGTGCVKTAVEHFGITITIASNYQDAIEELNKESREGFCDYYAVWVFCSQPTIDYKCILDQFNDILIEFWKNGGSIVFWARCEPFTYQVNLFLKTAQFKEEPTCPSGKSQLYISGNHEGKHHLIGKPSTGMKLQAKTFDTSPLIIQKYERFSLSYKLNQLFEGVSISYSKFESNTSPFIPLSRDSEGDYNILYYPSNLETGVGDIIIDCGNSKCFLDFRTDKTSQYIQNIAMFTARPEIHINFDKIKPCDWRPKSIKAKNLNLSKKPLLIDYPVFGPLKKVDVLLDPDFDVPYCYVKFFKKQKIVEEKSNYSILIKFSKSRMKTYTMISWSFKDNPFPDQNPRNIKYDLMEHYSTACVYERNSLTLFGSHVDVKQFLIKNYGMNNDQIRLKFQIDIVPQYFKIKLETNLGTYITNISWDTTKRTDEIYAVFVEEFELKLKDFEVQFECIKHTNNIEYIIQYYCINEFEEYFKNNWNMNDDQLEIIEIPSE